MKALICLLLLFIYEGILRSANALECYNCNGVDVLTKCTTKVTCKSDEHCHARKYISNGRMILYDVNCKPMTLCSRIEAKRREVSGISVFETSDIEDVAGIGDMADIGDIEMWTSCCATDECNRFFDSEGYLKAKTAMTCYSCKDIADPADCTQTTKCNMGEACFTHEKVSGSKKLFDMSCLKKEVCEGIGYHLQISRKRHTKRFELCRACCDASDNCNSQFCSTRLGQTGMGALGTPVVPVHTTVSAAHSTASVPLTTQDPGKPYVGYNLVVKPPRQNGTLGSTVSFDCEFDRPVHETMTITWYFRDPSGTTKQIYSGTANPPALDVFIKHLSMTDQGDYICEAKLNLHTWTAQGHLSTPGFIEITKGPDTISIASGGTATFTCEASGVPTPVITWEFLHKSPTPQKMTHGITQTTSGSQLVVSNVNSSNTGVYRCVVSSAVGTKKALAVLNVK